MSKLPQLSGKEIIKILVEYFDFRVSRQRGSHVVLTKVEQRSKRVTVVPLHEEVKPGTLQAILQQAGIKRDEFIIRARRKRG